MTDASRDEIVEVMAREMHEGNSRNRSRINWEAMWPHSRARYLGMASAALTALEAKGWKLVKGSHGISHGREGYDAGPLDAWHPSPTSTEEEA